jgi:lipopolysaccharide transport system permease protein
VFMIVFGRIANIPTQGIPQHLFYLSGIINWNYFAECLNKTSNTFTANSSVFGKVYFPRMVVPLSIVLSNLITYAIQLLLFIVVLVYTASGTFDFTLSSSAVFFPLLIIQMALLGLGMGIIVSSLTTKYKDLSFAVVFGVQLWMYATPIVYPMSQVPEKWQWVFYFNPMAHIVEMFRHMFFSTNTINWSQYGISWLITVSIVFIGITLFNRVEKSFMDTI